MTLRGKSIAAPEDGYGAGRKELPLARRTDFGDQKFIGIGDRYHPLSPHVI